MFISVLSCEIYGVATFMIILLIILILMLIHSLLILGTPDIDLDARKRAILRIIILSFFITGVIFYLY